MPEASKTAGITVFHLVQDLFAPAAGVRQDETKPSPATGKRESESVDKLAIWPPVSDGFVPGISILAGSRRFSGFQKILSELLGHTQATTSALSSPSTPVEREEEGETKPSEPSAAILRAARSVWGPAAGSYERLIEQLNAMQITAESACKIWPIAVAILLVTLATRRQIARCVADAEVPSIVELVGRFLHAIFADRWLGWRHGVGDHDRIGPTDPSVASVLHETYAVRPAEDIAGVWLCLLFAFQHAASLRSGWAFLLDGWLLFREIAPEVITNGAPPAEFATVYQRYLSVPSRRGSTGRRCPRAGRPFFHLGWPHHPGFKELNALFSYAAGKDPGGVAAAGSISYELWPQTERRIRSGKPSRCKAAQA